MSAYFWYLSTIGRRDEKSKAQLGSPCHWSEVFLRGNDIIRWFAIYNLKPVIYIHAFAPSKQEIWPFHDCFVLPDVWRNYNWHETMSIWYILHWIITSKDDKILYRHSEYFTTKKGQLKRTLNVAFLHLRLSLSEI